MRIILGLLVSLALLAPSAGAQWPKGVVAEDCTATWCVYCPAAYQGLEVMKSRYDANEFTSMRLYSSSSGGQLATAETDYRISTYYSVNAFPTVIFDGTNIVIGGGAAVAAGDAYDPIVATEIGKPSPLKITINSVDLVGPDGSINFDVEVKDGIANIANTKIRASLLEDDIYWCCGAGNEDTWENVTRDILPETALTVSQVGQVQHVTQNFTIDGTWETPQLWMTVFVQNDTDKSILQAESTRPKPAYSMRYWAKGDRAAIAPSYSSYDFQDFAVFNLGTSPDVIRVSLDNGALLSGWSSHFTDGTNNYTTFVDLSLNPGESRAFHMRIDAGRPGYAKPKVILTSTNLPGVQRVIGYNLVTDDVQVLLVDDDGSATYENYHTDGLGAYGATYGVIDRNYLTAISGAQLANFPAVFWQTGLSYPTLNGDDRTAISAYLDGGGKLFATGQEIGWELNSYGVNSPEYLWYKNYLHAIFKNDDSNKYNLTGVAGDPISDGMTLVITGGDGANNQEYPDAIDPNGAVATTIFTYNQYTVGKAAIKADTGVHKVVYTGFGFEAISTQANRRLLIQRILQWFNLQPMDVGDSPIALDVSGITVYPNPANPGTTMRLSLASPGPARLDVYALDGSLVRTLLNATRPAGAVDLYWDGRNNAGEDAPSGVYFYRLKAGDATPSGKLILTR